MREASKTRACRPSDFEARYLGGKVLDIGCGDDLVCPWAEPFDLAHGDANHIRRYREAESYDAVHSSHCLEHMTDPKAALDQWWSLVKPGGWLIVVVPEETLYEQGLWPSRFNADHKSTWRLGGPPAPWSPVSYDLRRLCEDLPGAEIVSAQLQDQGYDYSLLVPPQVRARGRLPVYLRHLVSIGKRLPFAGPDAKARLENGFIRFGFAVDQTRRDALAQIEVIVRKAAATDEGRSPPVRSTAEAPHAGT